MDYVDFFTHAIPRGNIPAQMTTIHAGTAAQGGYSSNFMNGQGSNGSNVAAVYFQQGNFGIVYLSEGGGFPRPHVIENVSAVDFVDRARERYGVVLNCRLATSAGYYNRGVLRDTKDERDDANADYTQAIEKDGTNAHAYHNRGANGLRAGQFDSAIADLTKAIELKQDYDLAYSNRALAHKKKGMVDAALDDYTKAIAVNPASAELYFFRGVLLDELDRREEAIADYTKMIELNPGHAKAYNNRGRLYLELGLREKALSDLQQAAEVDPTDPDYRQNLMVVLASSLAGYGPSY
jgi:tetratricopeptide (TPR) repeat protein